MNVKIALVGLGGFMVDSLYPRIHRLQVELVGICDKDPEKIKRFERIYTNPRSFTDFTQMIQEVKPDAVICAANAETHYNVAKFCLEKGIHVFIDKAPCSSAAQARELADLSKKTGKLVQVDFTPRFKTSYMLVKDVVSRKEFGTPALYYSKFHSPPYSSVEFYVSNHLIYHLDLACYLLGKLENITVFHKIHSARKGAMSINFTTEAGTVGVIQGACMTEGGFPWENLDILADSGRHIAVDNLTNVRYDRSGPARNITPGIPFQDNGDCLAWNPNFNNTAATTIMGIDAMLNEFYAGITEGKPLTCDIASCVNTMTATETVIKAIKA
jgi:myo-inositol 2-dehydrogenase/D-chiro-inositol 1-dehydrogenase